MRAQSVVAGILAVLFLAGCANTREAEAQPETQDESAEQVQTETPRTSYEDTALVGNSHVSSFFTYNALPGAACLIMRSGVEAPAVIPTLLHPENISGESSAAVST